MMEPHYEKNLFSEYHVEACYPSTRHTHIGLLHEKETKFYCTYPVTFLVLFVIAAKVMLTNIFLHI